MIRRPPRSTRTDTLFPYTTLFRSRAFPVEFPVCGVSDSPGARIMSDSTEYIPPKVWAWEKPSGGTFSNINRPIAGATHEKEIPVDPHTLQLYSSGTTNAHKVTNMREELQELGNSHAENDAWQIKIQTEKR